MLTKLLQSLETRYFFYIVAILFRIILDISYITFQHPVYAYTGFTLNISGKNYIVSWIFTLLTIMISPHLLNKVSDYFIVTFCFVTLLPIYTLYGLNSDFSYFTVLVNFSSFLWIVYSLRLKVFKKGFSIPFIKNGQKILQSLCSIMVVYLVLWYIVSGAVSNFNLDFSKVYEFRTLNSSLTNIGILTYLNGWVYKVFNLTLITYALYKRKKVLFIILLTVQLFFYGVSAHKAVLFTPLIIVSIYFYFTRTKSLATMPLALLLISFFCLYSYLYLANIIPGALIINRVLFIPNYLTFIYFDFFSNNSFSYWSDSFNILLAPVYPEGIPSTIGKYLGTDEFANNGYISSGYAQAGLYGIVFYNFLITLILKLIDQLAKDTGVLWLTLCIVITPLRTLIMSADLMTTLLTHGLFLSILMLILIRKPRSPYEI